MIWFRTSILITGGSGSLGRALVRRLLAVERPRRVIVYSRDEAKHLAMRGSIADPQERIRYFVGDVRDRDRLRRAMTNVEVVIHAAALKQVPTCEFNVIEAVRTNVDGAVNVVDAAIDAGVERALLVSTDKAAAPATAYGATKLVAERLFVHGNAYAQRARFAVTRYGNVVASRGSVIPVWQEAIARGEPIEVTATHATRYWITLAEAVEFVLSSVERMEGGEVFVPILPAATVGTLAEVVAPGHAQRTIGLRVGEKLHEVLISADEARSARLEGDRYVLRFGADYTADPHGLMDEYGSDSPRTRRLGVDELRALLEGQEAPR